MKVDTVSNMFWKHEKWKCAANVETCSWHTWKSDVVDNVHISKPLKTIVPKHDTVTCFTKCKCHTLLYCHKLVSISFWNGYIFHKMQADTKANRCQTISYCHKLVSFSCWKGYIFHKMQAGKLENRCQTLSYCHKVVPICTDFILKRLHFSQNASWQKSEQVPNLIISS